MADCHWPKIDEPFASALREALAYILAEYEPVGIVVGGSVLRGQGDATSDLDIYVIHQAGWRQRAQKRFNGVAVEIFVNPPAQVQRYFAEERRAGRPVTAHLLTTGFVVLETDASLGQLRAEAALFLQQRPDLTPQALEVQRYMAVDLLDNAADVIERSPETALFVLEQAMQRLIVYAYLAANRNLPRQKETIDRLDEIDPTLQQLARTFYSAAPLAQRHATALEFAERAMGVSSFFEWASEPQDVS
jgi:hypothetical protein